MQKYDKESASAKDVFFVFECQFRVDNKLIFENLKMVIFELVHIPEHSHEPHLTHLLSFPFLTPGVHRAPDR